MARIPRTGRWRLLVPALAALSLLGATARCESRGTVYGLTADSLFQQGCFPPLACPGVIGQALGGTFRLVPVPQPPGSPFDVYAVEDVYWLARFSGEDIPITGSGTYTIGGEFGILQRMQLQLRVGDAPIQQFDSGFTPVGGAVFPEIDVRISIHGEMYLDTVIDVRALPFPRLPPGRTPCGPDLQCETASEVCVQQQPLGPAIVFSCEPVPQGCEDDRTCGCASDALCEPPFDACRDVGVNAVECQCLQCQ